MNKQLIRNIMSEIYALDAMWPNDRTQVELILEKHLSLPKQEQYDIDDIMRQINSQWKNENFLSTEQSQRIRRVLKNNLIKQEQEDTKPIEQLEARVKYIEDTIHKIIDNNLKIREKLNALIEDYSKR